MNLDDNVTDVGVCYPRVKKDVLGWQPSLGDIEEEEAEMFYEDDDYLEDKKDSEIDAPKEKQSKKGDAACHGSVSKKEPEEEEFVLWSSIEVNEEFDSVDEMRDEDVPDADVPNEDVPNEDVPNEDVPNEDVPNEDVPDEDGWQPSLGDIEEEEAEMFYEDDDYLEDKKDSEIDAPKEKQSKKGDAACHGSVSKKEPEEEEFVLWSSIEVNEEFDSVDEMRDEDVPDADVPNEDVPNEDVPNEDVPNEDVPNEDVPNEDVPDEDGWQPSLGDIEEEEAEMFYEDDDYLEDKKDSEIDAPKEKQSKKGDAACHGSVSTQRCNNPSTGSFILSGSSILSDFF
ncbi:germ cell nuclear acidic protein-like [Anopheles ziemanni]|uniref:germ cell nuclear acidic protein-like n=1 Tax=Anopheles ziemanni TaxID=345580 RepID=UPI00265F562F|nr:germ cell nuclear acidic protein-like [Anopheles ziemanni]